jgi:Flp pilus assembly protein TadB
LVNQYKQQTDQLRDQIFAVKVLRDAQRPDSARHDQFQQEINDLTDEFVEWRSATPDLIELDHAIEAARRRLAAADRAADGDAHITRSIAQFFGVIGIICLLISATWAPSIWFPVLTFVFLAVAIAAIMLGTRTRKDRAEAVDEADEALKALKERREDRVPAQAGARWMPTAGGMFLDPEVEEVEVE